MLLFIHLHIEDDDRFCCRLLFLVFNFLRSFFNLLFSRFAVSKQIIFFSLFHLFSFFRLFRLLLLFGLFVVLLILLLFSTLFLFSLLFGLFFLFAFYLFLIFDFRVLVFLLLEFFMDFLGKLFRLNLFILLSYWMVPSTN